MNGILLIDKPAGITSHTVVSRLRKKLGTKKIGHAGTLDPSATGLLVICVGYATKVSAYLMESSKAYQTRFCLGKTTSTYDLDGEVLQEKDASGIQKIDVENALKKFCGKIYQKPPIYSAIKINGKKLYQYARSNTEIEIPERLVTIHALTLQEFSNPVGIVEMKCSKGTYVRSLIHDLGESLRVGACVEIIRRTESSPFSISNAISLPDLLEMDIGEIQKKMISVRSALSKHFQLIEVTQDEEILIRNGVEYDKSNFHLSCADDTMFLFVAKQGLKEVAIAKWGTEKKMKFLRIL